VSALETAQAVGTAMRGIDIDDDQPRHRAGDDPDIGLGPAREPRLELGFGGAPRLERFPSDQRSLLAGT
jgi:hypothetical protein